MALTFSARDEEKNQQRGRDSNPRSAIHAYTLSRRAP